MKKIDTYTRSRLEILGYISQFCMSKNYGGRIVPPFDNKHVPIDNDNPPIGSLCVLGMARYPDKWYISWLVEIKGFPSNTQYLLKSIEDATLCWWSNCGILAFPLEMSEQISCWKWTDEQFEFRDRFVRACRGYYITIPLPPIFNEDGSVTLGFRKRFDLGTAPPLKDFPNWRKLKSSEMKQFYKDSESYKKNN